MPRSSREKSLQTREKILAAAYQAFVEHGYNATSMRVISKKAGVTVGAIYNHFQTKEDIWKEVLFAKHPYHDIFPYFQAGEGQTVQDFIQIVARGMVNELRKRPDLLNLMFIEIVEFRARHMPQLIQSLLPELFRMQDVLQHLSGKLRGIPLPVLARSFGGLFFSYYVTEIILKEYGGFVLDESSLDQFVDLYLYGIIDQEDQRMEDGDGPAA